MAADESKNKSRKEKAKHELKELLTIFYLTFFFCALVTYSMLLLNEYHIKQWDSCQTLHRKRCRSRNSGSGCSSKVHPNRRSSQRGTRAARFCFAIRL